ncbi:hypothetical protein WT83_16600 [Burkholderia territorii]|uniref:Fis family transcriptional regulator n=1 Tax=Burkholderia territorii TaxID=1503055 RepID=A0A108ENQ5_9BURK|nr:hypothetical protein [Burkholderia territorii]KWN14708.1 hypothetical protein WT83_16600 [Burkholderia territorii]
MKHEPGRSGRRALTKEQLLPLPTEKVRALSLGHHMALATVRSDHGSDDQVLSLLRVIYLAFYLRYETVAGIDTNLYRQAEMALDACIVRAERGEKWLLLDREAAVIERVLVVHDAQLAAVPVYRYVLAWERLERLIVDTKQSRSPIPVNEAV